MRRRRRRRSRSDPCKAGKAERQEGRNSRTEGRKARQEGCKAGTACEAILMRALSAVFRSPTREIINKAKRNSTCIESRHESVARRDESANAQVRCHCHPAAANDP